MLHQLVGGALQCARALRGNGDELPGIGSLPLLSFRSLLHDEVHICSTQAEGTYSRDSLLLVWPWRKRAGNLEGTAVKRDGWMVGLEVKRRRYLPVLNGEYGLDEAGNARRVTQVA